MRTIPFGAPYPEIVAALRAEAPVRGYDPGVLAACFLNLRALMAVLLADLSRIATLDNIECFVTVSTLPRREGGAVSIAAAQWQVGAHAETTVSVAQEPWRFPVAREDVKISW